MLPESTDFSFLETPDDLGLLQLIDPQAIRDLARDVNALTPDELGERKLIILLATGGTLAMRKVNGIRTPAFDWKEVFHPAEGLLLNRLEIRGLNAFNIDSSQMDFRHVQELAITMTWLWRNITVPFEGFVVTHGTDTMAYSSAALSLMMGQGLPFSVAYTGAQRPLDDPMSDAPINLRNAFYVLESLHRKNMAEVVVVMGTRAILATSAEKVDDTSCNAFDAPWHSYVARLDDVSFPIPLASWLNPRRDMPFAPTIWQGAYAHSLVIKSTMGQDPELLVRQISDEEVKGVIFFSYGAGTVHEAVLNAIVETSQKLNKPLFIVNPVHAQFKPQYESGVHAIQKGAIPLNMTLGAAIAKMEIAFRLFPGDRAAISRFMSESYVGEVPSEFSSSNARHSHHYTS